MLDTNKLKAPKIYGKLLVRNSIKFIV